MIFSPWKIGEVTFRNRLVRSATNMRMAGPRGEITEQLIEVHRELAEGGIGLDVTGHAFVSPEGRANEGQIGVHEDFLSPGLARLAEAVHRAGARIFLQLAHAGMIARPLSGSRMGPYSRRGSKEMTREEIEGVIASFVEGGRRAWEAGFDGVQLHAAHGYLLSQFLSPMINKREDEYGGIRGGVRVLKRIITGIKERAGEGFPVIVKIGMDKEGRGMGEEELIEVIGEILEAGLDGVEISRGATDAKEIIREGIVPHQNEAYNLDVARRVKGIFPSLPVILVGGIRSVEVIEEVLSEGIDAVALCRPLLAEPHLPRRWQEGDRRPSECISCNRCIRVREKVKCRREN